MYKVIFLFHCSHDSNFALWFNLCLTSITEKSSTCPNQPHSQEVKDSSTASKKTFKVPFDFISSQFAKQYPHEILTKPTLDLSYTSSLDIPHQYSSLSEELQGVSSKEPLYLNPKTKFNHLHRNTRAYIKSLGQIPIIYQIPRFHPKSSNHGILAFAHPIWKLKIVSEISRSRESMVRNPF